MRGISEVRHRIAAPASSSGQRDPSAGTMPSGYQSPGRPMVPVWDAWQAFQYGYYANTFVYACVKAIAEDVARLPIRVGDPNTGEYDEKHPLAKHLGPPPGGPNPATAARKLIAWSVVQWMVAGRIGWEIETNGRDVPVAYWPLPAAHLKPIASQGGVHYFDGFEYGPRGTTNPAKLGADRVFYTWDPMADDWRQPESRLQAMRLDVSVAVMQDRYDYAFLKNDSRPAAIVVHEAFASRDERDAWRRQFRSRHEGPDNAGRVAFTEAEGSDERGVAGALDVKVLGFSQKDSQAIQRYDAKLRAICVGLGVPLSRLGDASGRTFANADAEERFYWRNTILPKLCDFQDALTMQLLPRYGRAGGAVYFDTSGVQALQEGSTYQEVGLPALVEAGIVTRDEARSMIGMGPLGQGDLGDSVGPLTPETPAMPPGDGPPALAAVPDPASSSPADAGAASRRPFGGRAPIQGPGSDEIRATNLWRRSQAQVETLERVWMREVRRLFRKQERAVLDRLEGKRGRQMLTRAGTDVAVGGSFAGFGRELFDPAFWEATTAEILQGLYAQVFGAAGARVSDEFGVSFDLLQPGIEAQIQQRANKLAGQVTDTTFGQIQDQLTDGVLAGDSIDVLADRIRLVFDAADERRARTIARTEVISSYNGAQVIAARQLPADVVGGMEWISTRDGRTRSEHRGSWPEGPDGQVVAISDSFHVGGETLQYPGDPTGRAANVINCRCTVAFLDPDEFRQRMAEQLDTGETAPTAEPDASSSSGPEYGPPEPEGDQVPEWVTVHDTLAAPEKVTAGNIITSSRTQALDATAAGKKLKKVVDEAMDEIASVIRIPGEVTTCIGSLGGKDLTALPFRVGRLGKGVEGSFTRSKSGKAVQLSLRTGVAQARATFVHEFGHFLDFGDFGSPGSYKTGSGGQGKVLDLLRGTDTVKQIQGQLDKPKSLWITITDEKGNEHRYANDHAYAKYLLNEQELWARAFAQYIATKTGNRTMLRELAEGRDGIGEHFPTQWTDAEFAPIMEAMDALFTAQGMLL